MKQTFATVALLALAACQQQDPNNIAIDESNAPNAAIETLPPDEGNEATAAANADAATAATIPAQYHGRWGMGLADCEPGRADAKGLITIGDRTMEFYEATATLKQQRPAVPESFSGLFGFTGEGQTWEKVQTLTRTGDTLKRAEVEGTFTYKRCA